MTSRSLTPKQAVTLISQAIAIKYDASVSQSFTSHMIDEGYEDTDVIHEITEEVDVDDMSSINDNEFVEYLHSSHPSLFATNEQRMDLVRVMKDAANGKLPQRNANTRPNNNNNNNNANDIPSKIKGNVFRLKYEATAKEADSCRDFVKIHCPNFNTEFGDRALWEVVAMGAKNGINLLNLLTDTQTRFRVEYYLQHKTDILATKDWMQVYPFFCKLSTKYNLNALAQKLNAAISAFHRRLFRSVSFANTIMLKNDSLNDFADYYIAMHNTIQKMIATKSHQFPFQVDMWIIPKAVESSLSAMEINGHGSHGNHTSSSEDDDGDDDDDDDDDDGDDDDEHDDALVTDFDVLGNIDYRLKFSQKQFQARSQSQSQAQTQTQAQSQTQSQNGNGCMTYIKRVSVSPVSLMLTRVLSKALVEISGGKRRSRTIVLVDRRDPQTIVDEAQMEAHINTNASADAITQTQNKNTKKSHLQKSWKDSLYFIKPEGNYARIPDEHTTEILFYKSMYCMLPQLNSESAEYHPSDNSCANSFYGVKDAMNGYQFTLSWHCEDANTIKCYLFSDCYGLRLLPVDIMRFWPKFFSGKQSIDSTRAETISSFQQIQDPQFRAWYADTVERDVVP